MAKESSSKTRNLIIGGVAIVVVIAAVIAVIMLNKKPSDGGNDNSGSTTSITADSLKNPDVKIAFGDFDSMKDLAKKIQNGEMTGKIIEVDGTVLHPGSSYSIGQKNGSSSIGTVFKIEDSSEYPADKAHVKITGKVVEDSPMVFIIKTVAEKVVKQ